MTGNETERKQWLKALKSLEIHLQHLDIGFSC